MITLGRIHGVWVSPRRVRVLAGHVAELLPHAASVLDVGAGDGAVAAAILRHRPDLRIRGIDVRVRPGTLIPVAPFDGRNVPFADRSFDAAILVDVLHHTQESARLLAEASRVARGVVVVKDHLADRVLARPLLRFMDFIGNARHGVPTEGDYWSRHRWRHEIAALGLVAEVWREKLGLYPPPFRWAFESSLHFVALLRRTPTAAGRCPDLAGVAGAG